MDITTCEVYSGPNIGLYAAAGNDYLLVPSGFVPKKAGRLADLLGVEWHAASISGTRLLGAMSVHTGSGMLLPKTLMESEYDALKCIGDVHVIDARYTALGNLICANDRGAVVSPLFSEPERRSIQDALGVEAVRLGISGMEQSGALVATNSTGTIVHPMADEDEVREVSEVLKTKVEPSTINNGVPFVTSGVLVNDRAVLVGNLTTGPEIMMLTRAFME